VGIGFDPGVHPDIVGTHERASLGGDDGAGDPDKILVIRRSGPDVETGGFDLGRRFPEHLDIRPHPAGG
jgi:hypothetical protein